MRKSLPSLGCSTSVTIAIVLPCICAMIGSTAAVVGTTAIPECPSGGTTIERPQKADCITLFGYSSRGLDCLSRTRKRCCPYVNTLVAKLCHCYPPLNIGQRHANLLAMWSTCSGLEAPVSLMVGVLSSAKNNDARMAIRETWASNDRLFRVLFFMARPREPDLLEGIRQEEEWYGDIVLLPSIWEHYHNITYQTLEILRFAAAEPFATHVMKVDDDSYVRVVEVMEAIGKAPRTRLLMGAIEDPGGGPHRDPQSRWYVTPEEWPNATYPPWAHGAGYIISQDLARQVAAGGALQVDGGRLFKLEDVAVGSWLDHVARSRGTALNLVHDPRFNYLSGCHARDVVSHYISAEEMRCMHSRGGQCCKTTAGGQIVQGAGAGTSTRARRRSRRRRISPTSASTSKDAK
eukprot:jgi/Botrbrau1/11274/Bobra.0038s0042.1